MSEITCSTCPHFWPCNCEDNECGGVDGAHGACCFYAPEDEGEEVVATVMAERRGCGNHPAFRPPSPDWDKFLQGVLSVIMQIEASRASGAIKL